MRAYFALCQNKNAPSTACRRPARFLILSKNYSACFIFFHFAFKPVCTQAIAKFKTENTTSKIGISNPAFKSGTEAAIVLDMDISSS